MFINAITALYTIRIARSMNVESEGGEGVRKQDHAVGLWDGLLGIKHSHKAATTLLSVLSSYVCMHACGYDKLEHTVHTTPSIQIHGAHPEALRISNQGSCPVARGPSIEHCSTCRPVMLVDNQLRCTLDTIAHSNSLAHSALPYAGRQDACHKLT
jgi:hypothetical protein